MAAAAEEAPLRSLWEEICAEFEAQQPVHPDHLEKKEIPPPPPPSQVLPDAEPLPELSGGESKPVIAEEEPPQKTLSLLSALIAPELPDLKTCAPREFLECYIFPVLLPGMVELLHEAKKQRCFERKQTRFIALDFLTEWLYNHNAKRQEEPFVEFFEIPFVKDWLKDHPRPPIPLSLLLTEKAAGHIIQTFWKGYRVRCDPEVQELRQWQKHLRETKNINKRVREFWANQEKKVGTKLEDSEEPSPSLSKTAMADKSKTPEVKGKISNDQLSSSKLAENSCQSSEMSQTNNHKSNCHESTLQIAK
ncbi:IQ domain-containing protein K isoform X2 [Pantherophis guttatus]|uniref:IQ domain-containing protein K isoform X2 n=1 Tax=Pantherophis guttatus TaxID=94885 RepID=A0A6P9CGW0_PANGU|nr:IQ domain-containing protein K isoform X2 [Pantherophis guttatus]